jgi:hypothetical protein
VTNIDDGDLWVKSTKCDTGACLEARVDGDWVLVRNTTDRDGQRLAVPGARWSAFVDELKKQPVRAA